MTDVACTGCGETKAQQFFTSYKTRCKRCLADAQRAYRRKRPKGYWQNKDKRYALKKRYGLSLEDFERMLSDQRGCCAICGVDPATVPLSQRGFLHVDHDHATGRVRGLLCNGCNRAIGFLRDSAETADAISEYLRKHGE